MGSETRCCTCDRKRVVRSYMKACDPCGQEKKLCVKCGDEMERAETVDYNTKEMRVAMKEYIATLRERSRRTVNRKLEQQKIRW